MKFVISAAFQPPEHLVALGRAAEEAGFEAIASSDHAVYPEVLDTPYPYTEDGVRRYDETSHFPDPWVLAGALSSVTERIRFTTNVYVLPMRNPFMAAKQVATGLQLQFKSDGTLPRVHRPPVEAVVVGRLIAEVGPVLASWIASPGLYLDYVGAHFSHQATRELSLLIREIQHAIPRQRTIGMWQGHRTSCSHQCSFYRLAGRGSTARTPCLCGGRRQPLLDNPLEFSKPPLLRCRDCDCGLCGRVKITHIPRQYSQLF